MTRVLILANEHVNQRMAGPAIRTFEMSRALAAAGHEVTLGAPFPSDLPEQAFAIVEYGEENLESLARAHEVVVLQGWVLDRFPSLRESGARLVIDLYDPFPLEVLILSERDPMAVKVDEQQNAVRAVSDQIRDGDFFLCASEKQRDYWLGWLSALNRVNPYVHDADPTLRALIDVVPFGIPSTPPRHSAPAFRGVIDGVQADDFVLLWGGGIYNWFDPMTLVRGVAIAARSIPRLRLVFMSTGHPNPAIQEMWTLVETRRIAGELGLTGVHVFFNDSWVEYDRRADWFLEADVGVSTHFDHVETRFSFRTRILDYFWGGLPVITTRGDTLADTIEAKGLGRTVPPEDPEAVGAAIVELATDSVERRRCASRVADHASTLTWGGAVQPLARFCASARRAPDLAAMPPVRRVPVMLGEIPKVGDAVEAAGAPSHVHPPEATPGRHAASSARHLERSLSLARRLLPARIATSRPARRAAATLRAAAAEWRQRA